MTAARLCFVLCCTLVCLVSSAVADFEVEAALNGAHTGNIHKDSSEADDAYTTATGTISFYPTSFLKI
ncbi:MAG: hypothetical protein KKA42_12115, partial [candidate division Zixibacteria bacterium]|nr:hypothetical protein [candidate division Zixibacteria bacterium]